MNAPHYSPQQLQMQSAVILPIEHYQALISRLDTVEKSQQLHTTVIRQLGWIRMQEAMRMTGIKSHEGIKAAANRGELVMRYKSEKVIEFSLASIVDYLDRKGKLDSVAA